MYERIKQHFEDQKNKRNSIGLVPLEFLPPSLSAENNDLQLEGTTSSSSAAAAAAAAATPRLPSVTTTTTSTTAPTPVKRITKIKKQLYSPQHFTKA